MPGRDLTDIRPENFASYVEKRHVAFPVIAGIVGFALVVGYAGYCFHSTAEMIEKRYESERPRIDLQRSFEKNPPVSTGEPGSAGPAR